MMFANPNPANRGRSLVLCGLFLPFLAGQVCKASEPAGGQESIPRETEAGQAPRAGRETPKPDTKWAYKAVGGKELEMDVFLPEDYAGSKETYPAFVVFHGGSWTEGDTSMHYPDCAHWSKRGMVAVSVDYRLKKRDNVEVPLECVKDAKSAIRFLRGNAGRLKIDPDRIVAAGGSAGGQLAAALATVTSPGTDDVADDTSVSCAPNAVVLYNPYFKCAESLSPPAHVRASLPPTITFLGDADAAITVASLMEFHGKLKAKGNASEYYVGVGGKHGFCNGRNPRNPFFYWSLGLVDVFLARHGILDGASRVEIPEGIPVLGEGAGYKAYR